MSGVLRETGYADISSGSASQFIPELFSGKMIEKLYLNTIFGEISNTDYEGEISSQGDSVVIRTTPSVTINDHKVGQALVYETLESPSVKLNIDQAKSFSFRIDSIDKFQSDINLIENWSNDAGEQMKIAIDASILGSVFADVAAENAGANAGVKSGNINLGITATPVVLTKANVIDHLLAIGLVMDEQNIPDSQRWAALPPWMCMLVKGSDLKDASLSGDGTSMLRNGKIGMIDRFTIYSTNNLSMSAGVTDIIFGHKKALTFAAQMTEMDSLKNPNAFGDLIRGLNVYGFSVIDPKAIGHSVVVKG